MKHGDFSALAEDYSRYRPDYSEIILDAVLGMVDKPTSEIDAVDVGAGTGIWTRMLANAGLRSVTAVEPNDDMRHFGHNNPDNKHIVWLKGQGENTGLPDHSADLLTMASSFHWVNFDMGLTEFNRVLRSGGCFAALWNPRYIENNPLLVEIESQLAKFKGSDIKRVSSGRSEFTETLHSRLENCGYFKEVVYLESRHNIDFSQEQYMGAWRSVNDLRVQLGVDKFQSFLDWVKQRISHHTVIKATYLTRAWVARKS